MKELSERQYGAIRREIEKREVKLKQEELALVINEACFFFANYKSITRTAVDFGFEMNNRKDK